MISNNKLFKIYLNRQSMLERTSLKDMEFITKCRNEWKVSAIYQLVPQKCIKVFCLLVDDRHRKIEFCR